MCVSVRERTYITAYLFLHTERRRHGKCFRPVTSCAQKGLLLSKILRRQYHGCEEHGCEEQNWKWESLTLSCSHLLRYDSVLGIIGFGSRKQSLNRKESSFQSQRWAPLVFQDIEAYGSTLTAYIRMPILCKMKP